MSMHNSPPKIARWLLKFFCRSEYRDEVTGDLQEIYEWRLATGKVKLAKYRYFLDALSAIRFYQGGRLTSLLSNTLFFSFIKSSLRNFKRHAGYTSLNLLGLAFGLSSAIFILQYVSEELNYNASDSSDRIYRVSNDYYRFGKMIYESSMTFSGVGPAMKRDIPEVDDYARLYSVRNSGGAEAILTRLDKPEINFKEPKLYFAGPSYLNFFDLTVIAGVNGLSKPNTIMLTSEYAQKYFGSAEEAIGKSLKYNDIHGSFQLIVTGIYERPDFQLQIDADVLVSYSSLELKNPKVFVNDWGGNDYITFVKLTENADPKAIERKMSELTLQYKPSYQEKNEEGEYIRVNRYFLTGITDIHLHSKYQNEIGPIGDATIIRILQVIALFIVIIAWINFINLSTAKSVDRAREVGVRKVMGAHKSELIMQFFTEAILINTMALALALGVVAICQPLFNLFVEKNLSLQHIDLRRFGLLSAIIFPLGTALSGLYPAFVISSHPAINALKGKSKVDGSLFLRRGLITFQLLFSSLLIIATLTINEQLRFMNSQALGFDMEQVLVLKGPIVRQANGEENISNIERFKQEVLTISGVKQIGTSTVIPGEGILRGNVITRVKEDHSNLHSIERVVASNNFLSTIKVHFLAGQDFDSSMEGHPIILNETAANELGFYEPEDAIGQIVYEGARADRKIVGVIEDYHHESLNRGIDAMYFIRSEAYDSYYAIRMNTTEVNSSLEQIEEFYKATFPGNPADYYFLDQFFDSQYKGDRVNRKVFSAFSLIAIIVACLGLYGLSSFSVLQRTKEVGIRKVLGASIQGLFLLLSKEVFLLVAIAFVLAVPIAWLGIESWLNEFAYRMPITPILFLVPLLLITLITLLATASKILRVTLANPVTSLRYE